jgi:hypothetical protein
MSRFHVTPTGPVPYTPAEESARDAEEAADAVARQSREQAEARDAESLAPIRAALSADTELSPAQLRRLLRHLLGKIDGGSRQE